jgi:hypothetical protein
VAGAGHPGDLIAFHVWQIRFEDRRFNAEMNRLRTPEQVAKVLKNHAHRDGG